MTSIQTIRNTSKHHTTNSPQRRIIDEWDNVTLHHYSKEMEIRKDVVGYEGFYRVSNMGNVMSNNFRRSGKSKKLSKAIERKGYERVVLCKDGCPKSFLVHRLVGFAFLEQQDKKEQINHKNGITNDNRVENIEWCSNEENQKHRVVVLGHTTRKKIKQIGLSGDVIRIWDSQTEIEQNGIAKQDGVSACCSGKITTHYGYTREYL